jgi:hypothetical protein
MGLLGQTTAQPRGWDEERSSERKSKNRFPIPTMSYFGGFGWFEGCDGPGR